MNTFYRNQGRGFNGFTTASEEQNENSFSFFPRAIGGNVRRAFTLIELLVVIAIISLLSSIVLASLSSARASARDARRVQDMQQLRTAIELYRNQHGYLPGLGGPCGSGSTKLNENSCIVGELETVMSAVPTDPSYDGTNFYYAYDPNHANTSGKCDGSNAAVLGFNQSETGIDDRETTSGSDQNLHTAAYNRVICWSQ